MAVRVILALLVWGALIGFVLWDLSGARPLSAAALPAHTADPQNGKLIFDAAGCAACHAPRGARGEDRLRLGGGQELASPVGTFVVPNISPHPEDGIGRWSALDLVNATLRGVSPDGRHYYPSFPYPAYRHMRLEDAIDLDAYLRTLPPVEGAPSGTELAFPFEIRRGIGLWKRFAMSGDPPVPAGASDEVRRGAYLTNALGHCGECHTPRTALMALDTDRWMAGAPNLEGRGFVPNLTPSQDGLAGWSAGDIAYLLETGFTPDFDSVGGTMAAVVDNWANVPAEDRAAVAAYLQALPPLPDAR